MISTRESSIVDILWLYCGLLRVVLSVVGKEFPHIKSPWLPDASNTRFRRLTSGTRRRFGEGILAHKARRHIIPLQHSNTHQHSTKAQD